MNSETVMVQEMSRGTLMTNISHKVWLVIEAGLVVVAFCLVFWRGVTTWEVSSVVFLAISILLFWILFFLYNIQDEPDVASRWLRITQGWLALGCLKMFLFFSSTQTIWIDVTNGKVSPFLGNPFTDTIKSLAKFQSTSFTVNASTGDDMSLTCTLTLTDFSLDTSSTDWGQNALTLASNGNPNDAIQSKLAEEYGNVLKNTLLSMDASDLIHQQENDVLSGRIKNRGANIPNRLGLNPKDGDVAVLCQRPL